MASRRSLPAAVAPLALTYLAIAMNMTIANVALPTISVDLVATASELSWLVNITPMVAAAGVLFAGSLSDRVGPRHILIIGVVVFLIAALGAGFSSSIGELIAFRGLSGVGSALAMPAALSLTFSVTTGDSQRLAVGIMAATQAVGSMLGPLIGGAALVAFGWPAAFWAVAPMLALALLGIATTLPGEATSDAARRRAGADRMDGVGAALTALVGLGFLLAAVAMASASVNDDSRIAIGVAVGVVALVTLVIYERHTDHPVFVGAILRRRTFWVPTLALAGVQFTLGGLLFLTTQYIQLVLGFSAFAAGAFLLPALAVWAIAAATASLLARRFGVRNVTATSLLVAAAGLGLLSRADANTPWPILVGSMLLIGTMGVTPALMTHMAVSNYPTHRRGVGSAINSITVRYGLAFGVAVFGTLVARTFRREFSPALAASPDGWAPAATESLGGALRRAGQIGAEAGDALTAAAQQAFLAGFHLSLVIGATLLVTLAMLVRWVIPAVAPPTTPTREGAP